MVLTLALTLLFDMRAIKLSNELYRGKCSYFTLTHEAAIDPKHKGPYYAACRWDYQALMEHFNLDSKSEVKRHLKDKCKLLVHAPGGKRWIKCDIVDWGPGIRKRVVDLSFKALRDLNLKTDDIVCVKLIESED